MLLLQIIMEVFDDIFSAALISVAWEGHWMMDYVYIEGHGGQFWGTIPQVAWRI
jgi:hypothetical protein